MGKQDQSMGLAESVEKCLGAIGPQSDDGYWTVSELSKAMDITVNSARKIRDRLIDAGEARCVGRRPRLNRAGEISKVPAYELVKSKKR